ncbi:unnamed protein product [Urochloa humidicola]
MIIGSTTRSGRCLTFYTLSKPTFTPPPLSQCKRPPKKTLHLQTTTQIQHTQLHKAPLQGRTDTTNKKIFIQAIVDTAVDPLQAETHALTLASRVLKRLQFQQVHYITDCQLLASTLHQQDPITKAADWRIRPLLDDFIANSTNSVFTVSKTPRTMNSIAHALAAQAKSLANQQTCLYACNNPLHTSVCEVQSALQDVNWGDYRLISVSCL